MFLFKSCLVTAGTINFLLETRVCELIVTPFVALLASKAISKSGFTHLAFREYLVTLVDHWYRYWRNASNSGPLSNFIMLIDIPTDPVAKLLVELMYLATALESTLLNKNLVELWRVSYIYSRKRPAWAQGTETLVIWRFIKSGSLIFDGRTWRLLLIIPVVH